MKISLKKIASRSLAAASGAAVLFGLSISTAHAAPGTITWDFTEVYSRNNPDPVIGESGVSLTAFLMCFSASAAFAP